MNKPQKGNERANFNFSCPNHLKDVFTSNASDDDPMSVVDRPAASLKIKFQDLEEATDALSQIRQNGFEINLKKFVYLTPIYALGIIPQSG